MQLAQSLDPAVEAAFGQNLIQPAVEYMTRRARQLVVRDKQVLLLLGLPLAHCHSLSLHSRNKRIGLW
jgi:hypothetical protein